MPKQETFFEQQTGDRRVEVLKSYDQSYALEAFKNMDEQAQRHLWDALKPEEIYDPLVCLLSTIRLARARPFFGTNCRKLPANTAIPYLFLL